MQFPTINILYSTDYVVAFRKYYNQFVYIIVSRSGKIITLLLVPLYVLFLWCRVYLVHFLCCFTHSNDKLYIWLTPLRPSPIFCRLNVYICYFVIFNIYNNITLLNATDSCFMNYRLIIYMISFFHLSLHFNRKIGAVVVVSV